MTVLFSFVLQEPPKPQFFMGIPPLTFTMFMPRHLQRLPREKQNYHEKNGFNHSGPSLKKSSISGACHVHPHVPGKMEQPNIWWKFESLGWNHAETLNLHKCLCCLSRTYQLIISGSCMKVDGIYTWNKWQFQISGMAAWPEDCQPWWLVPFSKTSKMGQWRNPPQHYTWWWAYPDAWHILSKLCDPSWYNPCRTRP